MSEDFKGLAEQLAEQVAQAEAANGHTNGNGKPDLNVVVLPGVNGNGNGNGHSALNEPLGTMSVLAHVASAASDAPEASGGE
jgi:uncharacterized protein involved in outer membrane biogenesis